jgi:hypothetical protein
MKKVLAIVVLLVLVAAAAIVPGKIKKASSEHEQRMFAAVETLGRSLRTLATGDNLKVGIYSPTAEFDDDKKLWSVSGIVGVAVSSGSLSGSAPSGNELFEPFSAQLRNDCKEILSAVCVRVETLTVGGARVLDIGQVTAAIPGLSSMPLDARNRAPSLIEMQAATAPGGRPALGRPPTRPPNPADMARTASVEAAKVPGSSPTRPAAPAPAQARPVSAEKTKQEAKAPAEPKKSRATSGGAEIAAREPSASKGAAAPENDALSDAVIMRIKRGLKKLGYDPGPINAKVGPEAFSAIMAYQRRYEFSLDGKPSLELLKHIEGNKSDSIY